MFQFKALEPHLTGLALDFVIHDGDLENKKPKRPHRGKRAGREKTVRLASNTWEAQAKKALGDPRRYRSTAIEFEVRLAEALNQCQQNARRTNTEETEQGRPEVLSAAVCCQMLGELGDACGPFRDIVKRIHNGVIRAVYSSYYVSDTGSLQFEQIPFFLVAERLEAENCHLLKEKDEFRAALLQREEEISVIEGQLAELRNSTFRAEDANRKLQQEVQRATSSEGLAKIEARAARDELKSLRRGNLKLQDEYNTLRALYDTVKNKPAPVADAYEEKIGQMERELAESSAQAAAAAIAANATLHAMQDELEACQARVRELEDTVQMLETDAEQQGKHLLNQAQRVEAAQAKARAASEAAQAVQAQLDIERALAAPDPDPGMWDLAPFCDNMEHITQAPQASASHVAVNVKGAGLGPHLPRCVRWAGNLQFEPLCKAATEDACHAVLASHASRQVPHGIPRGLFSLLHWYLSQNMRASQSQPSQSELANKEGGPYGHAQVYSSPTTQTSGELSATVALGHGSGDGRLLTSTRLATGSASGSHSVVNSVDQQHVVAQKANALMWSIHAWSDESAEVMLFREVLEGRLALSAWSPSRQLLHGLNASLSALGNRRLDVFKPRSEIETLLRKLVPKVPHHRLVGVLGEGTGDIYLQDLAADIRDGVPIASNRATSVLLMSYTSAAVEYAGMVQRCVPGLGPEGDASMVEFEAFRQAMLKAGDSTPSQATETAWAVASHMEGQAVERAALRSGTIASMIRDLGLPALTGFWNLSAALDYCEMLHTRSTGAYSQGILPPGA